MLLALRQVRDTMRAEEKKKSSHVIGEERSDESGGGTKHLYDAAAASSALRDENEALKKQVAKLNYRIEHLLRYMPQ